jgi:hypothetical protein
MLLICGDPQRGLAVLNFADSSRRRHTLFLAPVAASWSIAAADRSDRRVICLLVIFLRHDGHWPLRRDDSAVLS